MTDSLDAEQVPETARHLIDLARRWNIGDDHDLEVALDAAGTDELRLVANSIDTVGDDFWAWLTAPNPDFTPEWIAMSILLQAADSARVRLRRLE